MPRSHKAFVPNALPNHRAGDADATMLPELQVR